MYHPSLRCLAIACCAMLAPGAAHAAEREVVTITGHPNWPPFSYQQQGRIEGIGAELATIVLKDIGFEVQSQTSGNWKRAQAQAEAGAVDVIVGAYKTSERLAYLAYTTTPYMDDVNVLWVARGATFQFRQWEDLIGKRGTAMLGESYGERFDGFIKDKLQMEWVSTPAQSLQKLVLGRADYYPFSLYGGKVQVKELGFSGRVEHLPQPLSTESIYICVSKKSKFASYLPQIEAAVAKRRADGTVERLVRKYSP
jgi:polar amino acid transport system substrate-binding protein